MEFDPNPRLAYDRPEFDLGQRSRDHKGQDYVFCRITSDFVQSEARTCGVIDENFNCKRSWRDDPTGSRVGFVMGDFAPGDYAWVCIYGQGNIGVRANCGHNVQLYTSSTGGALDDSSAGSQKQINKVVLTTSRGTGNGMAPAVWSYPVLGT